MSPVAVAPAADSVGVAAGNDIVGEPESTCVVPAEDTSEAC